MRQTASKSLTVVALLSIFMVSASALSSSNRAFFTSSDSGVTQKKEQDITVCSFVACADLPKIFVPSTSTPSGNPTTPIVLPQYTNEFKNFGNDEPSIDLDFDGTWSSKGTSFTIELHDCTAGYTGAINIDTEHPSEQYFLLRLCL